MAPRPPSVRPFGSRGETLQPLRSVVWLAIALCAVALLGGCGGASYGGAPATMAVQSPRGEYADYDGVSDETGGDGNVGAVPMDPLPEPLEEAEVTATASGDWGESEGLLPPAPAPGADRRIAKAAPARGPTSKPGQPEPGRPIDAAKPADGTAPNGGEATTVDAPPPPDAPPPTSAPQGEQTLAGPLLIYDATIHMAVFEVADALEKTMALAKERGGYLVRRDDRTIVIRVPAASYRQALETIGKLGDVLHREENVEDVTDQFFDLQVRVRNARVVRERLEQLLSQAKTVEEALMVERELARVTTEIERLEGKLKLLRELVAFSTITVEFRPRAVERIGNGVRLPFGWLDSLGLPSLLSL